MFFASHKDTIIDHMEMALRGGYRHARHFIPTKEFVENPQKVDDIILNHARTLLTPLYPHTVFAKTVDEAFARKSAWLMDPFDGPMNEREQTWFGASTIALVEGGRVVAGGVYDIGRQVIYTGGVDEGHHIAHNDGERSWLWDAFPGSRATPQNKLPPCLCIVDVIRGENPHFRTMCTDSSDFIAAAFLAKQTGCVVVDENGAPWAPHASTIVVMAHNTAHQRISSHTASAPS